MDGSAKRFSHSHLHFCPSSSHSHRTIRTFLIFLLHVSQLVHQNVVESAKKCKKNAKKMRKSAKCDAKMESKFASHRTTTETFLFAFSHFFASHSHRTTIPGMESWEIPLTSSTLAHRTIINLFNCQERNFLVYLFGFLIFYFGSDSFSVFVRFSFRNQILKNLYN